MTERENWTDDTILAGKISDLWSSEYCAWKIEAEDSYSYRDPISWRVDLEWMSDGGNPHEADFVSYHWCFYSDTVVEAMQEALEWLEQLAPWAPCGECDGLGEWNDKHCETCDGTGLAK